MTNKDTNENSQFVTKDSLFKEFKEKVVVKGMHFRFYQRYSLNLYLKYIERTLVSREGISDFNTDVSWRENMRIPQAGESLFLPARARFRCPEIDGSS